MFFFLTDREESENDTPVSKREEDNSNSTISNANSTNVINGTNDENPTNCPSFVCDEKTKCPKFCNYCSAAEEGQQRKCASI